MGLRVIALLSSLACASPGGRPVPSGVLEYLGDGAPTVLAFAKIPAGTRLRAYKIAESIGDSSSSVEVVVAGASRRESSPLRGPGGEKAAWQHSLTEGQRVPERGLWVCLPAEWRVESTKFRQAVLRGPAAESGSILMAYSREGLHLIVKRGSLVERFYYYLDYELPPEALGPPLPEFEDPAPNGDSRGASAPEPKSPP